jgi:cob(I)alamin adenosyltransferase
MEETIQNILNLKDNVQSYLIKCGFDLDKEASSYSIKMALQETQVLLKSTFLSFNRRSFVLTSFFTESEIDSIALALNNIEDLYQKTLSILSDEDNSDVWVKEDLQVSSVFSYPNQTINVREKQMRPYVDLPLQEVPDQLDFLKPLFRPFAYKGSEARGDAYKKLNENLHYIERLQSDFISNLDESKKFKNSIEVLKEAAGNILGEITTLKTEVDKQKATIQEDTNVVNEELSKLQEKIDDWEERIQHMHIMESQATIAVNKAEAEASDAELSRKQLDRLLKISEANNKEASEAKEFLDSKLTEANALINQANTVLNLSGTVSLGKFYDDQYNSSKGSVKGWLFSCGVLLLAAVVVCMWALIGYDSSGEMIYIFSRLSVVPLLLGGLWFCATQYIKQKHIIEDYAYKRVLALSMVSFRNEIKNSSPNGVDSFVSAVLQELHKPPLDSLERKNLNEEVKLLKGVQTEMLKEMLEAMKTSVKTKANPEADKPNP